MLTSSASFGESQLQLQSAVLLFAASGYHGGQTPVHATFNRIEVVGNVPTILPGRLATEEDLVALTRGLGLSRDIGGATWMAPNVLAQGGGRTVWFTPASTRALFFKCERLTASGSAPVPALVWMTYEHQLYVYALKDDTRPERATTLCQAPFFNVWSNGRVCVGTAKMPTDDQAGDTEAWERGFFESFFTHPNFAQKDRLVKGAEPHKFWEKMLATPPAKFPKHRLVELSMTVQDLLDPALQTTLSGMGRAQGEF